MAPLPAQAQPPCGSVMTGRAPPVFRYASVPVRVCLPMASVRAERGCGGRGGRLNLSCTRSTAERLSPPHAPGAGRGGLHAHTSLWQCGGSGFCQSASRRWCLQLGACFSGQAACWPLGTLARLLCVLCRMLSDQHLSTFPLKCYLVS